MNERRQLTVLFCDMVGFTELAARVDPEVLQRACSATLTTQFLRDVEAS